MEFSDPPGNGRETNIHSAPTMQDYSALLPSQNWKDGNRIRGICIPASQDTNTAKIHLLYLRLRKKRIFRAKDCSTDEANDLIELLQRLVGLILRHAREEVEQRGRVERTSDRIFDLLAFALTEDTLLCGTAGSDPDCIGKDTLRPPSDRVACVEARLDEYPFGPGAAKRSPRQR